jgi:hypothetical protein
MSGQPIPGLNNHGADEKFKVLYSDELDYADNLVL